VSNARRGRPARRQGLDEVLGRHVEYLATGVEVPDRHDALVVRLVSGRVGGVRVGARERPSRPALPARDGEDVQDEVSALRERLPFPRLKEAVAERAGGVPDRYRAPLG
jgi:hypothetical protein